MVLNQELNSDLVINKELNGYFSLINISQNSSDITKLFSLKTSKNILLDIFAIALFAIVYVIVFIPAGILSLVFYAKLKKLFGEILNVAKTSKLETNEDYDYLKGLYNIVKRLKEVPNFNEAPFFIRIFVGRFVPIAHIILEIKEVLASRLYPKPEGITDEQLKEIAAHLKSTGFYERNADIFDDDDDVYDRDFALGKFKKQTPNA